MDKAIIQGKIVRFAKLGNGVVDLSVLVFKTHIFGNTFTLGTVISCRVLPEKHTTSNYVLKEGGVIPVIDCLKGKEPYKTACSLAVDDRVTIEFRKNKSGDWQVTHIAREPAGYQDINEFLSALEKNLKKNA